MAEDDKKPVTAEALVLKVLIPVMSALLSAGLLWLINTTNDSAHKINALEQRHEDLRHQIDGVEGSLSKHGSALSRIETSGEKFGKTAVGKLDQIQREAAALPKVIERANAAAPSKPP